MKEFEFRLGKLGLVLFVIGISFLLFLAFVTGVMVGVNMEGNPDQVAEGIPGILKQKVGRLASGEPKEEQKGAGSEARKSTTDKGNYFTFFDTLSRGKGPGAADSTPAPKAKTEESRQEPSAAHEARTAAASAGKFVIQVISLQDKKRAEDLKSRLDSMGYASYIDSAELGDRGRWYRVKLKGFETKEQAQKVADGLQEKIQGLQCLILPAGS